MSLFSLSDRGVSAEPAECQPRRQLSRRNTLKHISDDPLSSELCFLGAPLTLPLVHLPAGKGNCISEQATSLLRSFNDQPLRRECFLLAGTPSACRAPVTDEIPWLSSCLMSFLPANSHVGPGSHFSSAFLPFHLHREKNGPEVTAVTLWLLVLMDF